jgi:hypothetical protein
VAIFGVINALADRQDRRLCLLHTHARAHRPVVNALLLWLTSWLADS